VAFGAGLLITNALISPHPNYAALGAALALVGIGIGITVVPVTSSVLTAVPSDRSGMAASVANTSREMGAVTGVAILGALVTSRLTADLGGQLQAMGVPAVFKSVIINGIETGQTPTPAQLATFPQIKQVYAAAYNAFGSGLHAALYLSAGLVLLAAVLAAVTLRDSGQEPGLTPEGSAAP
jgi:sugar phosphate permease